MHFKSVVCARIIAVSLPSDVLANHWACRRDINVLAIALSRRDCTDTLSLIAYSENTKSRQCITSEATIRGSKLQKKQKRWREANHFCFAGLATPKVRYCVPKAESPACPPAGAKMKFNANYIPRASFTFFTTSRYSHSLLTIKSTTFNSFARSLVPAS